MIPAELYSAAEYCLLLSDPAEKARATRALFKVADSLPRDTQGTSVKRLPLPGMPEKPKLVDPKDMQRRGVGTLAGRIALLHALAHIEFNAINLALDAVYRFRDMPQQYALDWLQVASDESKHYDMLATRLDKLGSHYGALDAHAGLWNMAVNTDHDVLVRMALVPRVLEARGLDVAPGMIEKLKNAGDNESAAILDIIYHDEIEHVRIGNRWFLYMCKQRKLEPTDIFRSLLQQHSGGALRGPYNSVARIQAGFSEEEIDALVEIEAEFRSVEVSSAKE